MIALCYAWPCQSLSPRFKAPNEKKSKTGVMPKRFPSSLDTKR